MIHSPEFQVCSELNTMRNASLGRASVLRAEGARNQTQAPGEQDQHDHGIEEAGGLKIDVQVGDHAGQNEERPAGGEQPPDGVAPAKEQDADADQHWQKGDAESIGAVKAPIGTADQNLVGEEVASHAGHGETEQKAAQASRRAADVARSEEHTSELQSR